MATTSSIWDAEQSSVDRKKVLAKMLMQQSLQPIQAGSVNGIPTPISPFQGLSHMAGALLGAKMDKDSATESQGLAEKQNKYLIDALTKSNQLSQGSPARTVPDPDSMEPANVTLPASQGDPRKAAEYLIASGHPVAQQLGAHMMQSQMNPKEWSLGEIGAPGDQRQSVAFNKNNPKEVMPLGVPIKKTGQQIDVTVSTEKKYGEKFAENIAKNDADLRETAAKAPNLAERANKIKEIIANGNVATGMGADYKLAFGKAAASAGIKGAEDFSANTEVLSSSLAQNTLDSIKASGLGAGNGFSNADRDFLEKAVGGKINLEPKTIDRLADLAHKAAEQTASKWNKRSKEIPKDAIQGTGISTEDVVVPPRFGQTKGKTVTRTGTLNGKKVIQYSDGSVDYAD